MVRICCVCKQNMGDKEPLEDKSETHGICDECLEIELRINGFLDKQGPIQILKDMGKLTITKIGGK